MTDTRESNLVTHARHELELLGEDAETIEGLIRVIQAFADMGHSGGSAEATIPIISDLLRYNHLTPITDDPDEWQYHGEELWPPRGVWQSRRNPSLFSTDGGKTFYSLNDTVEENGTRVIYNSDHKEKN